MSFRLSCFLFVAVPCSLVVNEVTAADWGTLTGRFVYDGQPPKPQAIVPNKDVAFCGKHQILDERLVVNQDDNGIADIVIYLRKKPSRISPRQEVAFQQQAVMDNIECRFEPHVQLVRTGQQFVIGNKDAVGHNTNLGGLLGNPSFNVIIPALGKHEVTFSESERRPVAVACNIHPWMKGIVVVKDHPYMAKTDKSGNFEIKDLPTGEKLELQFWQSKGGYIRDVSDDRFSRKGRFKLTLKGDRDLGTIKVDPKNFND